MIKSTYKGQKHLDDFVKKYPKIYYDFEELIYQYTKKYGSNTTYDKIDLYDFTFQMRGKSRLKQMSRPGFFGAYAWYKKMKRGD